MKTDLETTEYVGKLKELTLSDTARDRIKGNLMSYAAFHSVRDDAASRSIGVVPKRASLFSLKFASMPFIILFALLIGGGTSLAAQSSVPGDFFYPVKIGVTENIRGALAVSADSEARLQANLLEERIEEAQILQADGRLSGEVATKVATNISTQAQKAKTASEASSEETKVATKLRINSSLQTFLAQTNLDARLASEISTSVFAIELATGLYDINAYRDDMSKRTEALTNVIAKHQSNLQANVKADLSTKLEASKKLTVEAQTQVEADARATLDKAATLAGEVEAKLSTLGQVEIDADTGIITDIDFSIDPMKIDRGDGNDDAGTPNISSSTSDSASDHDHDDNTHSEIEIEGSLDTDIIDGNAGAGVSGGASSVLDL